MEVVYANSAFTVTNKEYIIVFAHGGEDSNDLSSNIPQVFVSEKVVMNRLSQKKAYNAQKILFMYCYSALNDHIAQFFWKKSLNLDLVSRRIPHTSLERIIIRHKISCMGIKI